MLVQPHGNEQTHRFDTEQVPGPKPENPPESFGGGEIAIGEGDGHEELKNNVSAAKKSGRKRESAAAGPLVGSERVLRSKVQEKPPKPVEGSSNGDVAAVNGGSEVSAAAAKKTRGRKKKGGEQRVVSDEYSRIRKRLRYFLHRIQYEQNLIDAYSSEGWKGSSLEKLKPQKELQRATSEILRRKLKIRDLFQNLDSLCAEGRFPTSLFDSDGLIDSEDIFCAKCGSKDLPTDNDIILCDGACDRGFHQLCLEPPLLSDDIPPDEEGWLCPGCDCKVDCIDLLNDSYGTDLSVSDSWEKVFREEAAAAARDGLEGDQNLDNLSDDSEDDDYEPDAPITAEKSEGDVSSGSDESDFSSDDSASEVEAQAKDEKNLEGLSSDDSEDADFDPNAPDDDESEKSPREIAQQEEQNLGLSSDDSDDDNYDPDAPDMDDDINKDDSSSDFSSDSEDLEMDEPSSEEKEFKGYGSGTKLSLENELLGILDGSLPIPPRRNVERLDYKRLHDETYGNLPSESSDDEDFGSTAPRKRKRSTGKVSSSLPNGNASTVENRTMETVNIDPKDNEHTPRRSTRRNSPAKDANSSPSKSSNVPSSVVSSGLKTKSSTIRRLGEAVTQRLYKSFKENQYPDRATKESLAEELGISALQISKWFANIRWSWRHSSGKKAGTDEKTPKKSESVHSPQPNKQLVEPEQDTIIENPTNNGTVDVEPPKEASPKDGQKFTTPTSRQKRARLTNKSPETPAIINTSEIGVRTRGRQRKSAS